MLELCKKVNYSLDMFTLNFGLKMIPTRLGQVVENGFFSGIIRKENSIELLVVSRDYHFENHCLGVNFPDDTVETSNTNGNRNTLTLLENSTPGVSAIAELYPKWYVPSIVELTIILKQFPSKTSDLTAVWFSEPGTDNYYALANKFSVPHHEVGCNTLELVLGPVPLEFGDPELFSSTVVSHPLVNGQCVLVSLVKSGFVYPVSSRFTANLRLVTSIKIA